MFAAKDELARHIQLDTTCCPSPDYRERCLRLHNTYANNSKNAYFRYFERNDGILLEELGHPTSQPAHTRRGRVQVANP